MSTEQKIPENSPKHPDFTLAKLEADRTIRHSAVHFNGHLLCAIDCETTGTSPGKHDITQLAILPLTPDYELSKIFPPFVALIKPKRPENVDPNLPRKNYNTFLNAMTHGIDAWSCVDRLTEWFYALRLPEKKKIVPLGHNFINFDRPFIMEWLGGPYSYDEFFRSDARDTMITILYLNDSFDMANLRIPFPKHNLSYVANKLGIEHNEAHDALNDAWTSAQCYKKLTRWYDQAQVIGYPQQIIGEKSNESV